MTIPLLQYIASAENGPAMAGPAGPVQVPIICRMQDHNRVLIIISTSTWQVQGIAIEMNV